MTLPLTDQSETEAMSLYAIELEHDLECTHASSMKKEILKDPIRIRNLQYDLTRL